MSARTAALAMERERQQYILEVPRQKASDCRGYYELSGDGYLSSGVKACYIQPRTEWYENQLVHVLKNKTEMFQNLSEIDDQIVKIAMYIYDFPKHADRIRSFFDEKYGDFADFVWGGNDWLDMIQKNSGKGLALSAVLKEKGLKPEELMVFGDNQNDISMLELTPNSYAVDHAKQDVKVHAARTCESVTETLRQFITSPQTDN